MATSPDRLLPADPALRPIARRLYDEVRDLPIVSPHGHVDPRLIRDDTPFGDPAALFIQPDHYVTRLLHASGVPLDRLGVGEGPLPEDRARDAWRALCEHWDVFRGTPVRYWMESALTSVLDLPARPTEDLYDRIAERLTEPGLRPRALLESCRIAFMATTDDPADDLAVHAALAADPTLSTRIVPTFRPDAYLEPARPGWADAIGRLGGDVGDYHGYVRALEDRRRHFIAHGAVSADHSHADAVFAPLTGGEASRLYARALSGEITEAEGTAFRRHMMMEMARMSCDDGLVMTLHPGIYRNHHPDTRERFGPDTGHDIPVAVEFTRALQPVLARYGTHPGFHLVLFTVDPSVYAREIAPLAGFYPSVFAGVPWWFLDNPSAIRRFQEDVTEICGFTRLSGFIDDTRAFLSIPARHDMARRLDAAHLARLVAAHRLDEDEALDTLRTLVADQPRKVFKL